MGRIENYLEAAMEIISQFVFYFLLKLRLDVFVIKNIKLYFDNFKMMKLKFLKNLKKNYFN